MADYRVNLDIYNGPLDLLLYLIRREEVDVYDIPISRITQQYLEYVNALSQVDPNLAGEFLVLAATLMEIKTAMLLPAPPVQEGGGDLGIDPRAELVRQLLEYKAFKDAASDLRDAAEAQAMRFPRAPAGEARDAESEIDLEQVQIWDLFDAFSKLMDSIGQRPTHHEVIYDDTPGELHAADILDRLQREGTLSFGRVFEGRTNRAEIVGLFLAMLELIRQKKIHAIQDDNFGRIVLHLRTAAQAEQEQAAEAMEQEYRSAAAAEAEAASQDQESVANSIEVSPTAAGVVDEPIEQTPAAQDAAPPAEDDELGKYVSDEPAEESGGPEHVG
ncbi:MAG: segregation/condensation protein A [Phycisphaerae bacterium]|jgi:segregation and condensation protein A